MRISLELGGGAESQNRAYDCVFFDSGGTLFGVYNRPGVPGPQEIADGRFDRIVTSLNDMGFRFERKQIESMLERLEKEWFKKLGSARNHDRLMEKLCDSLGFQVGSAGIEHLADAYAGPRYREWLFPGTGEMLDRLSDEGIYLGIIANTEWAGHTMDRAFRDVGLLQYFKTRIYSSETGIRKPDPRVFRMAERASGHNGERALYVGNSLKADVLGAKAAGWGAALRVSKRRLNCKEADICFRNWQRLIDFIAR